MASRIDSCSVFLARGVNGMCQLLRCEPANLEQVQAEGFDLREHA